MQSESGVIHVVADRMEDLTAMLAELARDGGDLEALARADEVKRPGNDLREALSVRARVLRLAREEPGLVNDIAAMSPEKAMPKGRNFH